MKRTLTFSYMQWLAGLTLPPKQLAILFRLCAAANDDGWCWPGFDTLSKSTQLGRSTIIRETKALQKKGLIQVERAEGHVNRYRVCVECGVFGVDKGFQRGTRACVAPVPNPASDPCQIELLGGASVAPEEVTTLQETTTTKLQENARGRAGTARGEIGNLMRRALRGRA